MRNGTNELPSRRRTFGLLTFAAVALLSFTDQPSFGNDNFNVLVGTVTRVVDGDTLDVLLDSGSIRIRLNAIDAPEKSQPGGKEATAYLSDRILSKTIDVKPVSQDRYGRMVAVIFINGQNINNELVQNGFAWAFRKYMKKPDASLCMLEHQARTARIGLWFQQSPPPMAPWEFRGKKRTTSETQYKDISEIDCVKEIGQQEKS